MVHPGIPEENRDVVLGNQELERFVSSRELDSCIEARAWTAAWALTNFTRLAEEAPRS